MKVLNHPNLIRFHESFETLECYYYIIELVKGEDLFKYVSDRGFLEEEEASSLFEELAQGLLYLHSAGIVHRDMKPENVMVSSTQDEHLLQPTKNNNIKIIDFGFSVYLQELKEHKTLCGTLNYTAPEIYNGLDYDYRADIFSLGVVLYFMVRGELPFHNDTQEILIKNIVEGDYPLENDEHFMNVSEHARDLIKRMLDTDPQTRISLQEVLAHPWITRRAELKPYFQRNKQHQTFDVGHFVNYGDFIRHA